MRFFFFSFCLLHLCSSYGTADTKTVHQTPPFIIKRTGESLNDEIECSHRIENYEVILWYKTDQNGSLRFLGILNLAFPYPEEELKAKISFKGHGSKQSNLSVSDLQVSDAGVYYCAARRTGGNYEPAHFGSGTKLTVLDPDKEITPPTKVRVLKPSKNERKNEQKTLVCVASGFYPDHVSVSWKIDDDVVDVTLDHTKAVATDDAARLDNKTYTITSQLIVSSDIWFSNCVFICNVSFFNGTHTVFRDGNTTGGGIRTDLTRDKYLWITQSAKLSYIIFIAKSCAYGVFIWFVAWKLQRSAAKKSKK